MAKAEPPEAAINSTAKEIARSDTPNNSKKERNCSSPFYVCVCLYGNEYFRSAGDRGQDSFLDCVFPCQFCVNQMAQIKNAFQHHTEDGKEVKSRKPPILTTQSSIDIDIIDILEIN